MSTGRALRPVLMSHQRLGLNAAQHPPTTQSPHNAGFFNSEDAHEANRSMDG